MKTAPIIIVLVALAAVRIEMRRKRAAGRGAGGSATPAKEPSAARRYVERTFGDVGLVAARELRERTRGKIFRIGTLLILLAVAAAIVIPTLNKNKNTTGSARVEVIGPVSAPLRSVITGAAKQVPLSVTIDSVANRTSAESDLGSGRTDVVVDNQRIIVEQAVSGSASSNTDQLAEGLSTALSTLATIDAAHLSASQVLRLDHPVVVPIVGLTPSTAPKPVKGTTIISLILMFVLLSQYSAWILMGVAEEKSSRVVEVLLGTVSAIHLLSGKVLGIGASALAQASVVVAFALILAKAVGSDLVTGTAPLALASSLLWLVLGYAFYCWVYAAAGSLTERQSQLQSVSFPLTLPMLFGYIISITAAASGNPTALFKVLAYLPPTAPFAMPVLVGLGLAKWWEFLAAAALSIASTFFVARFAAGIYRRAILRTGRRVTFREVFRASA